MDFSFISFICSLKNSERYLQFYSLNTLSVSFCESTQFGDLYRKPHNRKLRNLTRKGKNKIPLLIKDQICTRDCIKQTSKLHNLETDLNLLTITFHLLTEQSYTSFVKGRQKRVPVMLSVRSLTVFKEKNSRDRRWT